MLQFYAALERFFNRGFCAWIGPQYCIKMYSLLLTEHVYFCKCFLKNSKRSVSIRCCQGSEKP